MQIFRQPDQDATLVGWGVRVLFLAQDGCPRAESAAQRFAGFGGIVEAEFEFYAAIEAVIEDPHGYGLFVMDCDVMGGLEAGRRAFSLLRGAGVTLPVILISAECVEQIFPEDSSAPILLRSPLSAVSLRVGFEHTLRDRLIWRAA